MAATDRADLGPRTAFLAVCPVLLSVRDWALHVLCAAGSGPPTRPVFWGETVEGAQEALLGRLLRATPEAAVQLALPVGWRELPLRPGEGSSPSGVFLVSALLLRAGHDALRPAGGAGLVGDRPLGWVRLAEVESGRAPLAPEWQTVVESARDALAARVQRDPELLFAYLGGWLTLAEATLLDRAFRRPGESVDESNLRKRFLATGRLAATGVRRPVRGRERDWRRVSAVYRYLETP